MNFPRIVLSSRNKKKIEEIAELMEPHGISLVGVSSFAHVPEVIEDADSFAGNAAKKASEVARQLGEWTIADDSGLCVDALKGAPGIYSARYADAPHPGSLEADECNNQKLLRELADVPTAQRTAFYVCAVALADPQGQIRVATEGRCHGRILREYHGINGFGYDPMFLVPEFHKSFGELSPAVKRHISHRAKAFERAMPQIVRLFETL
ncbi:MAG: RdgB/HAM1 family non-canonical purine NTP pyrophosphatase [Planctomycetota bacterium]